MNSYKFLISGRVQGVWYRATVRRNTEAAGFNGYVKNLSDGRVEAAVTCQEKQLGIFKELLEQGSQLSHVDHIAQEESDEIFSSGFEVR